MALVTISKKTARAAVDQVPCDSLQEFYHITNFCTGNFPDKGEMNMERRLEVFYALGRALRKDKVDLTKEVDISKYEGFLPTRKRD